MQVAQTRPGTITSKVRVKSLSSLTLTFQGCSFQELHTLFYVWVSLTVKGKARFISLYPRAYLISTHKYLRDKHYSIKHDSIFSNQVKRDSGNGTEKQRHLDTTVSTERQESKLATIMIINWLSKGGNLHVPTKKQHKDALTELLLAFQPCSNGTSSHGHKTTTSVRFFYLTVSAEAKYLTRAPSKCNEASLCTSSGSTAACAQSECTVWKREDKGLMILHLPIILHQAWKYPWNQQQENRQIQRVSEENESCGFGFLRGINTHK